jgi:UDP-N-acetylmuramoylalanine--D-glutamate ligase
MNLEYFIGKNIALAGFGVENTSVAKFLLKNNFDFTVLDRAPLADLSDEAQKEIRSKKLEVRSGEEYLKNLQEFDIVIRSPGVPYLTKEIVEAKNAGADITSSTKLFFKFCPAKIIGVTGTKGKGTTASIIFEIIKQNIENSSKKQVYLVGNIGTPSFDVIEKVSENDLVVFELSSFQLHDLNISPQISVVTNLTEDHLDYHKTLNEYRGTKKNILMWQKEADFAVINYDYPESKKLENVGKSKKYFFSAKEELENGAFVDENGDVFLTIGGKKKICSKDEIKLIGRHNLENIAASAIVGKLLSIPSAEVAEAVKSFSGLPHRLEFVREVGGVKFYNDSFSTNPTPTIAAIRSFAEPITLILGGSSKGADFSQLAEEIKKSSVKNIILIGLEGKRIFSALENKDLKVNIIQGGNSISETVEQAKEISGSKEVVLFSPACASFDMFDNYKDRGEKFKIAVNKL